jgi:hypothetical protein
LIVKKFVPMLMATGAMASTVGCSEESAPLAVDPPAAAEASQVTATTPVTETPSATEPVAVAAADGILVSLSVPNMV